VIFPLEVKVKASLRESSNGLYLATVLSTKAEQHRLNERPSS
jgi:hypothetical protein